MCPGLKQNTFTALARRTNQKSYLIRDTCDCLNNITVDAASLPPCMRTPPCTHTHGISNRISSPLSLSLSPAFTICRSPICPLCSIFPSNIPPLTPSPPLQPPALLPPSLPTPPTPGFAIGHVSPSPEFWVRGHSEPLEGWVEKKKS